MITAQDVKSGYGQEKEKPHTSVLPYLRAQAAEKEKAAAGNKPAPPKNENTEPEEDDADRCVQAWLKVCGYGR